MAAGWNLYADMKQWTGHDHAAAVPRAADTAPETDA